MIHSNKAAGLPRKNDDIKHRVKMKLIGNAAKTIKRSARIRMTAIGALLFALLTMPALAASDWQKFTPHDYEFSIFMPQPVETEEVNKGTLKASVFKSMENGSSYSISVLELKRVPSFDRYFKEVIAEMKQKGSIASAIKNESGTGWKGKRCIFSKDGEQVGVCLVALGNGTSVVYTLNVRSPSNPVDADQFFQSFVVYPEEAVEAHGKPKPNLLDAIVRSYAIFVALAIFGLLVIIWIARAKWRERSLGLLKKNANKVTDGKDAG
ncbi:MAG TPA: hypothetical protein V6C69_17400 [Trichormus sp.]